MSRRTPPSSQASEDLTWGWNVPAGAPSPSRRSTPTPAPSSPNDGPESPTSVTSQVLPLELRLTSREAGRRTGSGIGYFGDPSPTISQGRQAVFIGSPPPSGPAVFLARTSASPASGQASAGSAAASPSPSSTLWSDTDLPPSSSRMYRDSSARIVAGTSGHSSIAWLNSGMGGPTGFSTLATSECRSDDDGCSSSPSTLSEVLEPSAPQRFYLSARAASGILRRASKRGRELPSELATALTSLARQSAPSGASKPEDQPETSTTNSPSPTDSAPVTDTTATAAPEGMAATTSSVRRLTPVECERLMGWPEGWTISHRHLESGRRGRRTADPATPSPSSAPSEPAPGDQTTTALKQGSSLAFPWQKPDMSEMVLTDTSPPLEAKATMAVFSPSASTPTATDVAVTEL